MNSIEIYLRKDKNGSIDKYGKIDRFTNYFIKKDLWIDGQTEK